MVSGAWHGRCQPTTSIAICFYVVDKQAVGRDGATSFNTAGIAREARNKSYRLLVRATEDRPAYQH